MATTDKAVRHVDVLIIGGGLSGIDAAYHLQKMRARPSYLILEARDGLGGTWDLFRYPGIRSDSDLHTYSYGFKPWINRHAIADGSEILDYLDETARENGIDEHMRFGRRVSSADWDSASARWTVTATDSDGTTETYTSDFIVNAAGYYRYDHGYEPHFEGRERFRGRIIHPQFWPEDYDYTGKRIVVIGSGATAVTLIPALTDKAAHVTMLQRSPSYIYPIPEVDWPVQILRAVVGDKIAHEVARRKNILFQSTVYKLSQQTPVVIKTLVKQTQKRLLPKDYPIDVHLNPTYKPWDERFCASRGGDFFRAISSGRAEIVTDRIVTFDETGIVLESGAHLDADVIVTATGLELQMFGGVQVAVDGVKVDLPGHVTYKGCMLDGVPNLFYIVGYTNSSWTLKADIVCEYIARVLEHMQRKRMDVAVAVRDDPDMPTQPLIDFRAGYVQRSMDQLPRRGTAAPWLMNMSRRADVSMIQRARVDDGVLRFSALVG
jgi:cation diffusion facilitator CzcD-associated flavoprotein CzcO